MRSIRKTFVKCLPGLFVLAALVSFSIVSPPRAQAEINRQINFQGKLANPDGTNVADGAYPITFRIYTVPDGGTPIWTSALNDIDVIDGVFQLALGSVAALPDEIAFNNADLYLGVTVDADPEMSPRIQLTAAPYAFNSAALDGLTGDNFVQLAQGVQQDDSTATSIAMNKVGAGALIDLQADGDQVLSLEHDGHLTVQDTTVMGSISITGTVNGNTFNGNTLQFGDASTASIQSADGQSLLVTGDADSTISTANGLLTLQSGTGTVSLGTSTALTANGAIGIKSNGANPLTLDSGSTGGVNLGTGANAKAVAIGNTVGSTSITNYVGAGNSAYSIQGNGGAIYTLIDTTNERLYVGNPTPDSTAFVLVFDSKDTAGDPASGVNGSEYYNTTTGTLRCYTADFWSDCTTTRYLGGTTLTSSTNIISVTLAKSVTDLHCRLSVTGRTATSYPLMRFNNDSSSNYGWNANGIVATATTDWQDSTDTEVQLSGTQTATANTLYSADINITNFAGYSSVVNWSASGLEAKGTNSNHFDGVGGWYSTAQITSVQFNLSSGNYTAGSSAWCEGR
jgi:hypothetical protein